MFLGLAAFNSFVHFVGITRLDCRQNMCCRESMFIIGKIEVYQTTGNSICEMKLDRLVQQALAC